MDRAIGALLRSVAGIVALAWLWAAPAQADPDYRIYGHVDVYSGGAPPVGLGKNYTDRTSISDSLALYDTVGGDGSVGEGGTAQYWGDIAAGRFGVYAAANNATTHFLPDPYQASHSVGKATTYVGFEDWLSFTAPAGYYSEGVTATVYGHAEGTINVLATDAAFRYTLQLGDPANKAERVWQILGPSGGAQWFGEDFALSCTLVAPEATLTTPQTILKKLTFEISTNAAAWYSGAYGWSTSDFYNSASIYEVTVGSGVTWSSEAGLLS